MGLFKKNLDFSGGLLTCLDEPKYTILKEMNLLKRTKLVKTVVFCFTVAS